MKHRIFQAVVCFLVLWAAVPATAQELRIAVLDLPPYGYREGNKTMGLLADICERIAEEAGYRSRSTLVPLARGVKELGAGHVDMIAMLPCPELASAGESIGVVLTAEIVAVGRSGTIFHSLADLGGKRVAKIRGAGYGCYLAEIPHAVVCDTDSYAQNFRMLFAGRVDAVVGPKMGLFFEARSLGLARNMFGPPLSLARQIGYVYVSRSSTTPLMRQRLARALDQLRDGGEIRKMTEKYISWQGVPAFDPTVCGAAFLRIAGPFFFPKRETSR